MSRPYALLRNGFPYNMTIGQRRVTSNAVDIAFGAENIYVLCRGGLGTEIRVLDWEDNNLGTIGTGSFKWPSSILADKNENLYVSEEAQNKVYVFSKDGALLNEWGESGDGEGQFDRPTGMSFDTDNNIVLSDTLNNRIQKYTV